MSLTLRKPNLSSSKLNRPLIAVFVIGFVLTSAYLISAQEDTRPERSTRQQRDRGERGEGGRGQFNLAQMVERQTQRAIEALNLSDEETAVLVPKIKAITQQRMQQRQELRPFAEALRTAVDGEDDVQIKSALETLKAKRGEQKTTSEALEKELVELLTLRQEAQLTIAGVVNSDGGFGGFGGRRGRFGSGDRRRGDRPNRPRGNQ